jgi:antirestriction protein
MRIYVASLSDYNNGRLHGVWVNDCEDKTGDDIQAEVSAMLRASKFPNVMVQTCPDCGPNYSSAGAAAEGITLRPGQIWKDRYWQDGKGQAIKCPTCNGDAEVPSAEEWAIHDHEGFGSLIGESTSFDRVAELAELIEEHGDAFIAYAENIGDDATADGFQEAYQGEYDTLADWAEQFMDDTGGLSEMQENLRNYFDFEAYGRDAQLGGDIYKIGRYVFWNN